MTKPKKKPVRTQAAEISRRGAAAMAHATRGMSRTVESKKLYDRRSGKKGVEL